MTVAPNATLEAVYGALKQHENALARVQNSNHRVERDIFGEMFTDTRNLECELQAVLMDRGIDVEMIAIPENSGTITPHKLIDQRDSVRSMIASAREAFADDSAMYECLEHVRTGLKSSAADKLEVLCSAILSDQ